MIFKRAVLDAVGQVPDLPEFQYQDNSGRSGTCPTWFCATLTLVLALCAHAATLGRVVPIIGGAADLALDETRGLVYLTSGTQNQVLVYSLARQSFQTPVPTDQTPLAMARSRDGKLLYVACYDSSVLDVIDLASLTVTGRVNLPAKPEALAVGKDGRVLISTAGSGTVAANVLLLYNPSAGGTLAALPVTPPVAGPIVSPAPADRPFLSIRSQLAASSDGSFIAGVNVPAAGPPTVYLYESASGSVLRSRTLANLSTNLAISGDGTRVFCGVLLFDAATFQVLAQHSPVNAVYPINPATNFAALSGVAATNQGGTVFSPDGATLYAALNVAPVGGLATLSQLTLNDPDNLLIRMGLQLPETLSGKLVIGSDGANIYGLSDSGFVALPVGTVSQGALAVPALAAVLLTRDQCGVAASGSSVTVTINNPGKGRITATGQLLQYPGLANQASPATAPSIRSVAGATTQVNFSFNAGLTRGLGTMAPPHDFAIQSPEAVNIPDRVRVYENVRDSDARGTILPLPTGNAPAQPFPDLVYDSTRQRLYIANFGLNRVEVFDLKLQQFLTPVKVGQSPVSLALTTDGVTLYVANSGGESISIVDPDKLQTTGQVSFPPIAINSNQAILTPSVVATSAGNPLVLMSNGGTLGLWTIVGNATVPRGVSKVIGQTPQGAPSPLPLSSTMASTPAGDYVLLATPTGIAYLYDPNVDDFVAGRQVSAAGQAGFIGPVTAGPRGQYFVMNGTVLNQALVVTRPATGLVSAVAAGATSLVVFVPPAAAAANTLPAAAPTVQLVNPASGATTLQVNALEGPLTQAVPGARLIANGRTMAIDTAGTTVYAITTSGLSIIPLIPVAATDRPQPFARGVVNLGSYQTAVAPNSLVSIFGTNLGASEVASSPILPTVLGGICVTLNNTAIPLFMTSPGQINAQIPPNLVPGSYPLVIRSLTKQAASVSQQITVSKYAPAVMVDATGQIALFHQDGTYVNQDNPGNRDEPLLLYAVGLGATKGGAVTAGVVSPTSPLAVTDTVEVFFGDPLWKQAAIIVDWSGLAPGFIGLYQLNLRIPGFHINGDALPVMLRMGTTDSPTTGPVVPYVAVQ